jgi:hypothetical protein
MKLFDAKLGLVHLEVETRMQIAQLAEQLSQLTATPQSSGASGVSMKQYMEIYHELCNKILTPLEEAKEDVVSRLSTGYDTVARIDQLQG